MTGYLWMRRLELPFGISIDLAGELDRLSSRLLCRIVGRDRCDREISLDLSRITFVDRAGLSTLGDMATLVAAQGGRLQVERPAHAVRRLQAALATIDAR